MLLAKQASLTICHSDLSSHCLASTARQQLASTNVACYLPSSSLCLRQCCSPSKPLSQSSTVISPPDRLTSTAHQQLTSPPTPTLLTSANTACYSPSSSLPLRRCSREATRLRWNLPNLTKIRIPLFVWIVYGWFWGLDLVWKIGLYFCRFDILWWWWLVVVLVGGIVVGWVYVSCMWLGWFWFCFAFGLFFVTMVGCGLRWCVCNDGGLWVMVMSL